MGDAHVFYTVLSNGVAGHLLLVAAARPRPSQAVPAWTPVLAVYLQGLEWSSLVYTSGSSWIRQGYSLFIAPLNKLGGWGLN